MSDYFKDISVIQCRELEVEIAKRHGVLVYADGDVHTYKYGGILYMTEPPVVAPEEFSHVPEAEREFYGGDQWPEEIAHPEKVYTAAELDRGIKEAGFAVEPLTKALEEIARIIAEALG